MNRPSLGRLLRSLSPDPALAEGLEAFTVEPREVVATFLVTRITGYAAIAGDRNLRELPAILRTYVLGLERAANAHRGSFDSLFGGWAILSFGVFGHAETAPRDAIQAARQLLDGDRQALRGRLQLLDPRLDLAIGAASGLTMLADIQGNERCLSGCFGGSVDRAYALCELAGAAQMVLDEPTRANAGPLPFALESIGSNAAGQPLFRGTPSPR